MSWPPGAYQYFDGRDVADLVSAEGETCHAEWPPRGSWGMVSHSNPICVGQQSHTVLAVVQVMPDGPGMTAREVR
jgi:hypothetical protein